MVKYFEAIRRNESYSERVGGIKIELIGRVRYLSILVSRYTTQHPHLIAKKISKEHLWPGTSEILQAIIQIW